MSTATLAVCSPTGAKAKARPSVGGTKAAASPNLLARFSLRILEWQWEPAEVPRLGIAWESVGPRLTALEFTATPATGDPITIRVPKPSTIMLSGLDPFTPYRLDVVPVWETYGKGNSVTVKIPAATTVSHPRIAHPEALKDVDMTGGRPNPCLALHWRYNPARESFNALPQITNAVATLAAATGIETIYDGPTSDYEVGVADYDPSQADIEHPRTWLLVQWEDPRRPVSDLADGDGSTVLGVGSAGIQRDKPGLPHEFADGALLSLRNTRITLSAEEFRSTLLHELGHTMGLDHVNDETSIMFPYNRGVTNYSPADLALLAALGRPGSGGCIG